MLFWTSALPRIGRDSGKLVELRSTGGNVDMEHLGDDSRPAVNEVNPAVFDLQSPGLFVGAGLTQKTSSRRDS